MAVPTEHVAKDGRPEPVGRCALPLIGMDCKTRVYTSFAVINVVGSRFVLLEKLPDLAFEASHAQTGARLHLEGAVIDLVVPDL